VVSAALYPVDIKHVRPGPVRHAFDYRSYLWLVDVDDLPRLPRGLGWLARFDVADHLGDPGSTLGENVRDYLSENGIEAGRGRILMLANAKIAGYVFNPLSVYWCHSESGDLVAVIAEVHNTYGQRHRYLLRTDERGRAATEKEFYVSPFYPVRGRYQMSLPEPAERLAISITMHGGEGPPFVASMRGIRVAATLRAVLGLSLRHPLSTLAVSARIRKQGITLWLKGLRPYARPTDNTVQENKHMSNPHSVRVHGIDAERWPDVAAIPRRPIHGAVAGALFRAAVRMLPLRVVGPNGHEIGRGGKDAPVLRVPRPNDFSARVGTSGLIGFGEAYMAGDWEAADSAELPVALTVLARRMDKLVPKPLQKLRRVFLLRQPSADDNTVSGSKRNIGRHYDLSNELFTLFLDKSLSYSSALFDQDPAMDADDLRGATSGEDLTVAQHRKIDRLLDQCEVGPGSTVLEIGTGWGELSIRAAQRGAKVTTITISTEQADLARQRAAEAGVADRIDIRLQDYRETTGKFDAVISVEMIEAVGVAHWPTYFATLDRLVRPGGKVGLQAILMPDDRMRASRDTYTWIRKYIFPGGQIMSVEAIRDALAVHTTLTETSMLGFGMHYAETLRRWRGEFEDRAGDVDQLGFDETFRKMWSLYLAYSEAGFRAGYLDVAQFTFAKPGVRDGASWTQAAAEQIGQVGR
jgi:cyclopropane-fatty-acyl-phospholipid synthase